MSRHKRGRFSGRSHHGNKLVQLELSQPAKREAASALDLYLLDLLELRAGRRVAALDYQQHLAG